MAFVVQSCAGAGCDRLLYIVHGAKQQTIYCSKCECWTVFTLGPDEDSEEEIEE